MIIAIGALMGALSVVSGAFGAHAIRDRVSPELMAVFNTGTQYFQLHALAVIVYGLWATHAGGSEKLWPVWGFVAGTAIFTGTLYLITLTGIRAFGMITPLGGVMLILSWLGFAIQAYRSRG